VCKSGDIVLMVDFYSPPATTRVKVCFLNLPYQRDVPCRIPSIKPTPDNWFNVMESSDPTDAAEDDRMEYPGWLSCGAVLIHPTATTVPRPASAFPQQKRG
jgi:hypothetical protein